MKKALIGIAALSSMLLIAAATPSTKPQPVQHDRVARGAYLAVISGCHDCHTPKADPQTMAPDMARALSGRPSTTAPASKPAVMGEITVSGDLTAWYGPWGVSYSANLTPDKETGMGKRYNEASFIRAMRSGKKPEGEPLLPPMPWPNIARMSDEDLKSLWAYMQTVKPIRNNVKAAAPAH